MCKGCGLHNYCDKMRCFGCKLERPVEEEKPKEKEISEESISKNGFKMLKPGELTNSLLAAAEALASTQAITNTPIEPDPEPTKTEPKRVRRSRFDRAPPSMEKAKATTASARSAPSPKTIAQTWTCFHCKMENVAQNTECWFCKAGHVQKSDLKPASSQNEKWTCVKCETLHYEDRSACYKCRTPKSITPSQPQDNPNAQAVTPQTIIHYEIFVGNLSVSIDEDVLKREFAKYGPILGCRKPNDSYGFIEFQSLEKAVQAMNQMDGKYIQSQRIRCQWPKKKRVERNVGALKSATRPKRIRFEVFVGNLSDLISDQDLEASFSMYGTVISVRKPASFAFVQFATIEGALNAVNLANETMICGRKVNVQWPKDFDKNILENLINGSATRDQIQLLQNAMSTTTNVTDPIAAWNCPICHQRNFSKKLTCHRCHTKVDENGKVVDTSKTDARFLPQEYAASTRVAYF